MPWVLLGLAVAVLAFTLHLFLSERRDRRRLEALLGQVIDAEERARREVAQSLHDEALQSLLAAHQELIEAAPGRAGVTRAYEVVAGTISELREAVAALHPVTLEQGGLETAIAAVARRAERRGGFRSSLHVETDGGPNAELLLSVARELLTNAAKHASAKEVTVGVRAEDGQVVLTVADDGAGIAPWRRTQAIREGHIGLASVTHRVEVAGGSFSLSSNPGQGTTATARLPLG